jgi:hypothetical protein
VKIFPLGVLLTESKNAGLHISWTHDISFVPARGLITLYGDTGYLYVIDIKEVGIITACDAESQPEVRIVVGSCGKYRRGEDVK